MSKHSAKSREVVYADCNGELVFLPKELALELARIRAALDISKTWGEFQANVPDYENMQKRQVFYPFLETLPVFLVFFPEDF